MEICLLAPGVRVLVDGQAIDAGPLKERSILAVLALADNRVVPRHVLIERVWGPEHPDKLRSSVYSYINRIRTRLSRANADVHLVSRPQGYALEIASESVDWHRVRALRARAGELSKAGEYREASALLWQALELWQGDPLAEVPGTWAQGMRTSMESMRLLLVAQWAETAMELGEFDDVVAVVADVAAEYPTNERLARIVIQSLAASGRQAEALESYERLRGHLAETLGSDPGTQTQRVYQRILNGHPVQREVGATVGPRVHDSLRRDIDDFVARGTELAEIVARARNNPEATVVQVISGMAGVGKTALAVRAAHLLREDFDVRLHLDLHGHADDHPPDAMQALYTLLRMLDVPAERIPAEPQARAALWRSQFTRRRALLLFDDATHAQVAPLIPGTPGCFVLITSRRSLAELDTTAHLTLKPPNQADAVLMFATIAGLTPQRASEAGIARVVRACDRLPLALRIGAARLSHHPTWTPEHLAEDLSRDRLGQMRLAHHDVAAVFELSFTALSPRAQAGFLRLGLLPTTTFSLHTAAAGLGETSVAESVVEELLDAHLLEEIGPAQYRMHDLVGDFVRRRAGEEIAAGERRSVLHRVLDHYLLVADAADRAAHPERKRLGLTVTHPTPLPAFDGPRAARQWFSSEYPALEAVLAHAYEHDFGEHAGRIALALGGLFDTDGPWERAERHFAACLRLWRGLDHGPGIALAAYELGRAQRRQRNLAEAAGNARIALGEWERHGDVHGQACAHDLLGLVWFMTNRNSEALEEYRTALDLRRWVNDQGGAAHALDHIGMCQLQLGDYDAAESAFTDALALHRGLDNRYAEATTLGNFAELVFNRGYHRDAKRMCEQALSIFEELGDTRCVALALNNLGILADYKEDHHEALGYFQRAHQLLWRIGDENQAINAHTGIGTTQLALGHPERARDTLQRSLELVRPLEDPESESQIMLALGDTRVSLRQPREAMRCYRDAREQARRGGVSSMNEALAHERIGDLYTRHGQPSVALAHWNRALGIFDRLRVQRAETSRIKIEVSRQSGTIGA
ncbi:AfsR/SARP family transcriptional regulator [Halostreptopolyspora alba]|uniref:AfsR/SARP family transcriptional regulator n=1 Tax=Halostreptopolyspora alba TaxID=2487137 RepID=UPI00371F6719